MDPEHPKSPRAPATAGYQPEGPEEFWVEIIEKRRLQDPATDVFYYEASAEQLEWHGVAATSADAEEAAMAAFEERYGERPRYPFVGIDTQGPKLSRIKGRRRGERPRRGRIIRCGVGLPKSEEAARFALATISIAEQGCG
jgi:hypothetical protein